MGTNDLAKETRAGSSPGRAPMLALADRPRSRPRAPTASTSSTASTTTSGRRGLPRRVRAGPRPRLRRQDPDPPEPGRAVANEMFAPPEAEVALAAQDHRRLRRAARTRARASSRSRAAWSELLHAEMAAADGRARRGASRSCRAQMTAAKTNRGNFFEDFRARPDDPARDAAHAERGRRARSTSALYGSRFAVQSSDDVRARASATRARRSTICSRSTSCSARPCRTSRSTPSPTSATPSAAS